MARYDVFCSLTQEPSHLLPSVLSGPSEKTTSTRWCKTSWGKKQIYRAARKINEHGYKLTHSDLEKVVVDRQCLSSSKYHSKFLNRLAHVFFEASQCPLPCKLCCGQTCYSSNFGAQAFCLSPTLVASVSHARLKTVCLGLRKAGNSLHALSPLIFHIFSEIVRLRIERASK